MARFYFTALGYEPEHGKASISQHWAANLSKASASYLHTRALAMHALYLLTHLSFGAYSLLAAYKSPLKTMLITSQYEHTVSLSAQ
jgi:hypothetical protein